MAVDRFLLACVVILFLVKLLLDADHFTGRQWRRAIILIVLFKQSFPVVWRGLLVIDANVQKRHVAAPFRDAILGQLLATRWTVRKDVFLAQLDLNELFGGNPRLLGNLDKFLKRQGRAVFADGIARCVLRVLIGEVEGRTRIAAFDLDLLLPRENLGVPPAQHRCELGQPVAHFRARYALCHEKV